MDKSMFNNAVNAASTSMSTKSELIDYYKDKYGAKEWTSHIARDLHGTVKNKKGEDVSISNIQRRFQGGRELKEAKQSRAKQDFANLGEKLPRQLKGDSITVTVKGHQGGGPKNKPRERTIKVTLQGDKAREWVNNPNLQDLWDEYDYDFGDGDSDDDYGLAVGSISA
jgi:hypothetical protein